MLRSDAGIAYKVKHVIMANVVQKNPQSLHLRPRGLHGVSSRLISGEVGRTIEASLAKLAMDGPYWRLPGMFQMLLQPFASASWACVVVQQLLAFVLQVSRW